jgi:hypothetical protein
MPKLARLKPGRVCDRRAGGIPSPADACCLIKTERKSMPDKTTIQAAEKGSAAVRKPSGEARASRRPAARVHPALAFARASTAPASELSASDLITLQRTAGNRAVEQILAQEISQEPASDDPQSHLILQAKLSVGAADLASVEPGVERSIERTRTSGQSLPDELRIRMERSFGADFSRVRVHADSESDSLNRSLGSRAFTSGPDLFFKRGEYHSGSSEGLKLIAHELTHVIQQNKAHVAVVTKLKPQAKARSVNLSRTGNDLIQRNGPGTAQAPKPAPKPKEYDKKTEDERLEKIRTHLANKARANRLLGELFKEYEESWAILRSALSLPASWRTEQMSSFEATRKKLKDAINKLEGIDDVADALEIKHTELKARLEPHKKTQEALDETTWGGKAAWLLSYSENKKQEMKDKHTLVKPIVTREQGEFEKLDAARRNLQEIKLSESKEGEPVAVAGEIVDARKATRNVTPSNDTEKGHFTAAEKLITDLEKHADTSIKSIIETAMDKKNEYLDIETGRIEGLKDEWKRNKLHKNAAESRVKAAGKIQHEPTKDAWFSKLRLVHKASSYNWVEAGKIGGDDVHETLFHAQVTAKDIVEPALDALKTQVLGTGVVGYHITLETTTASGLNSHVYRGDERIRYTGYAEKYSDGEGGLKKGALTEVELTTQLRNKRDGCVARVETNVKDAQDNKGRGMMTSEVAKKLEE